ncbi:hypothetical protein [Streptomyces coeruleorubidus]|uniref:hypothetical protein n=1 Tax=Streptomyces coeruleorubidus TaxID=116188 RepID=UPI0019B021DE|nr:hypothetical protein [Streptomyces bellus]GGU46795.1 hypothetical protein GCM10010244_85670 [Streptomyces bellus]
MSITRLARPSRRSALLGVTAAVGLSAVAVALPGVAGAASHPPIRPTIVLEHGAFADAASWDVDGAPPHGLLWTHAQEVTQALLTFLAK